MVDDLNGEAIGEIDHGLYAVCPFETLGIQLGLLPSVLLTAHGLLCLYDSQGLAVVAKEHIVSIALAGWCRHTADLCLYAGLSGNNGVAGLTDVPTGLAKHLVDEQPAGFSL